MEAAPMGDRAQDADQQRAVIATDRAPAAIGPYSQAVRAGGLVFTAGQIPLDPATMKLVEGDITVQTERVMENIEAILAAAGTSFDRVVKTTCFLANLDDYPAFNAVYAGYFPDAPPARSTVQAARLPAGALVEVDCIALLD
jgi:2-iminobutanoate/2-iminopropanoate deaminase